MERATKNPYLLGEAGLSIPPYANDKVHSWGEDLQRSVSLCPAFGERCPQAECEPCCLPPPKGRTLPFRVLKHRGWRSIGEMCTVKFTVVHLTWKRAHKAQHCACLHANGVHSPRPQGDHPLQPTYHDALFKSACQGPETPNH